MEGAVRVLGDKGITDKAGTNDATKVGTNVELQGRGSEVSVSEQCWGEGRL